ncbi:MAG: L-fucose:H+ symporter permease [Bacteroidales bacterium]|nr:L-fucose:H+ symporter permease [Bacteroidales bacterium]MDT8373576.1 L-fucose:H+ symporter permease [Bacteroidales bacterium]
MSSKTFLRFPKRLVTREFIVPFILVTSLFFLWGVAHSLLDVLNKHFQDILGITRARSGLVQAALYGGYFVMAIPAGLFMNRMGYRKGIITGLLLYAAGAFLFLPATFIQTFGFTLFCLFVIACGLTFLETAANPYSSVLGPKETSEQRLTLSQSFNGLGWIIGPALGGMLILGAGGEGDTNKFSSMALPYMLIGGVVLAVAFMFVITRMPDIHEGEHDDHGDRGTYRGLLKVRHFRYAVVAQFLYVAAQTGINSFFINYVVETMPAYSPEKAAYLLSLGFVFFMSGRFIGSLFMSWFSPRQMLGIYALVNTAAMALVMLGLGWPSLVALYLNYFCMSIMFPTIFALGLKDLGGMTKKGSSVLVMTIVGGAICPVIMGRIADVSGMAVGFIVPLICFTFIAWYAFFRAKSIIIFKEGEHSHA